MLTLETLDSLQTPAGERLLRTAAEALTESGDVLPALMRLRRQFDTELARAAVETVRLRQRATAKFALAERMFFTAEALEQATSESVAAHGATRFAPFDLVADLGCSIGGDAIALARRTRVLAVERDPLRLAMARANVAAYGLADRVTFLQADFLSALPRAPAAFCDPGRRDARGRVFDVNRYQPPLPAVLAFAELIPALAVKVAPGVPDEAVPEGWEAEFVQSDAELKQALLWSAPLATARRRATLLPGGETLADRGVPPLPHGEPRGVLYEPQPALIRAHLVEQLGHSLGAIKLDDSIAFLTADCLWETPLATAYSVEEWLPFNLKRLRERLRALGVGEVVIKKRGSPLDPPALARALRLTGPLRRILVLTRVGGRHAVLICERAPKAAPKPSALPADGPAR
jgi:SAM-dependent methyltransferase